MRTRTKKWLARLGLPLALSLAGCPPPDHGDGDDDDATFGDDDSAAGDDDTTGVPDDDTGDDDVMEDYGPRTDDGTGDYHPDLLRDLER